jgi:arylsulfatase A-like enzyme
MSTLCIPFNKPALARDEVRFFFGWTARRRGVAAARAAGVTLTFHWLDFFVWTVPSHSAMFTGASVRRNGMGSDDRALDDRFETVADALSENGYVTASFSNNP